MKKTTLVFIVLFLTFTVKAQNNSPTFTSSPITGINEGQNYNYDIAVQDVDGDHVSISASTVPGWLSLETNINVSTFAGSVSGDLDGTGTYSQFSEPNGSDSDQFGNIYVADSDNDKIRKITPEGVVTTLAGSTSGFNDGTGSEAQFNDPRDLAVDLSGNVYVADKLNHRIRKITPDGVVTTIAGNALGDVDGQGENARFWSPSGIDIDANGYIYVADTGNYKIRRIDPNGNVISLAGGVQGDTDDVGSNAKFEYPLDVEVNNNGDIFVADWTNHKIRKVTSSGVVTTYAGVGYTGDDDGPLTTARFYLPAGLTIDDFGNIYVADHGNDKIRKISTDGLVSTIAGSSEGFIDGNGSDARFRSPVGISIDYLGNLYVGDRDNHRIRKITTTHKLTGSTSGQIGIHDVSLQVNDPNGGLTNQIFTIEVVDGTPPTITSLSPIDDSTNIEVDTNLEITFDKNILEGSGDLLIKDASDDSTVQTIDVTSGVVSVNGLTVTINPDVDLSEDKSYYIIIENSVFTDVANNEFTGISDPTVWNFSTTNALSTSEYNVNDKVLIYPNPVLDYFEIDTKLDLIDIELINLLGQQVLRIKGDDLINNKINISNMDKGVYFIRFTSSVGIISKKIVKN